MSDQNLPPAIRAAWGLRERPNRGPKPGLTLDRIVAAAVALADSDGIGAVSMGKVAAELGAATMSLYRYVTAKDDLLLLMLDTAYGTPPALPGPGGTWRTELRRWANAEYDVLRTHSWIVRVPISGPPPTPHRLGWLEAGLRCLRGTGLDGGERLGTLLLVTMYVRNQATLLADLREAAAPVGRDPDRLMSDYGRLVAAIAPRQAFPELHALIDAGVFAAGGGGDDEFAFGLERLLDGTEALVEERANG